MRKRKLYERECRDCGRKQFVVKEALSCRCSSCASKVREEDKHRGTPATSHYLYYTWIQMKKRCYNQNAPDYKDYGKRGVLVCARWKTDYWKFVEDMGDRPQGYTLDRINNEGMYEPTNCKWSTASEQSSNKRNTFPREVIDSILQDYCSDMEASAKYKVSRTHINALRKGIYRKEGH